MENKMSHPKDMNRWFGVIQTAMALVGILLVTVGFFGYLKFGPDVAGSVTLNLPNYPLYEAVVFAMVLNILFTLPLQEYVIFSLLWPAISARLPDHLQQSILLDYIFRYSLTFVQFGIAMFIPHLELIVPLVGVTAGMLISLIMPPLVDMVTFWSFWNEEYSLYRRCFHIAKDCCIIGMGVFGMSAGLYCNIRQIMLIKQQK